MIFKVTHGSKKHLLNPKPQESIEDLKKAVAQAFKLPINKFLMFYIDEEGDDITLNDEYDYAILTQSESKTVKIKIQESNDDVMD